MSRREESEMKTNVRPFWPARNSKVLVSREGWPGFFQTQQLLCLLSWPLKVELSKLNQLREELEFTEWLDRKAEPVDWITKRSGELKRSVTSLTYVWPLQYVLEWMVYTSIFGYSATPSNSR